MSIAVAALAQTPIASPAGDEKIMTTPTPRKRQYRAKSDRVMTPEAR